VNDPRPLATLSLDVDDLWAYLRTQGNPAWETFPSYLGHFIPAVLEALDEAGITITFFCVGADATREDNARAFEALGAAGHEIGNHSYSHESWLGRLPRERQVEEVARAEDVIAAATGHRPVGFRAPSFSWTPALLEILVERGYQYDASTFPTFFGPLLRAYYFRAARLTAREREQCAELFGQARDGLRPLAPYNWVFPSGARLLELPVTTFPIVRAPIHFSYLTYLGSISERLMMAYLWAALRACRACGVSPNYLLHPLDLLGGDEVPALRFFPGMQLNGREKRRIFSQVIGTLAREFRLVPLGEQARLLVRRGGIREQPLRVVAPATGQLTVEPGSGTRPMERATR